MLLIKFIFSEVDNSSLLIIECLYVYTVMT